MSDMRDKMMENMNRLKEQKAARKSGKKITRQEASKKIKEAESCWMKSEARAEVQQLLFSKHEKELFDRLNEIDETIKRIEE